MSFTVLNENHVLVYVQVPKVWHPPRVFGMAWHGTTTPFLHYYSIILVGTRKIANHYIRCHVFISLKRVDNGLVLGIVLE